MGQKLGCNLLKLLLCWVFYHLQLNWLLTSNVLHASHLREYEAYKRKDLTCLVQCHMPSTGKHPHIVVIVVIWKMLTQAIPCSCLLFNFFPLLAPFLSELHYFSFLLTFFLSSPLYVPLKCRHFPSWCPWLRWEGLGIFPLISLHFHKPFCSPTVAPWRTSCPVPLLIGRWLSGDPDAANPLACQKPLSLGGMKEWTANESPSIKNLFSFSI